MTKNYRPKGGDVLATPEGDTFKVVRKYSGHATFIDRFTVLFSRSLVRLGSTQYSPTVYRAFFLLLDGLSFDTWRPVSQIDLASALGVRQPAISKTLAALVGDGFLERKSEHGLVLYRLSADHGWRGRAQQWHAHQRQRTREASAGPLFRRIEKSEQK